MLVVTPQYFKDDLQGMIFVQTTHYTIPCITIDTSKDDMTDGERAGSNISIGNIEVMNEMSHTDAYDENYIRNSQFSLVCTL